MWPLIIQSPARASTLLFLCVVLRRKGVQSPYNPGSAVFTTLDRVQRFTDSEFRNAAYTGTNYCFNAIYDFVVCFYLESVLE